MPQRVLISGAFGDAQYRFGFFERIAEAIEREALQVERFNAFGFSRRAGGATKLLERLVTLPGRAVGIDKSQLRAALPWTADGQRERALLAAVRSFRPDMLIVIRGFPVQPSLLCAARRLGVRECVGWYVEGPLEAGLPERESLQFDRYYCIHTELEPTARARIGWLPSYGLDTQSFSRERWPRELQPRIVFVGTPTPRRVHFLEALRGLPLELWGPKWQHVASLAACRRGEFIWGPALNALYNSSAIVLNIASWANVLSGMTQRVVEIPASGAFMLTDAAPEVFTLFAAGREMDVFDSPQTLRQQCERYLADAPLREAIAEAGHARALCMGDFSHAAAVLLGRAHASPPAARGHR